MSGRAVSSSQVVGRALLVTNDSAALERLVAGMRKFAIAADICSDLALASTLINTRKFEAIVVDVGLGNRSATFFERVRLSSSNKNAIIFAIVTATVRNDFPIPPNFTLSKPLTEESVMTALRASLGLIIRDYRRYFRCPVSVPVSIQLGKVEVVCELMNISEGGFAAHTQTAFKPGSRVTARFTLPEVAIDFEVEAEICWCDNKGRVGLEFRSLPGEHELKLQSWLSSRIEQGLPEPAARLFRNRD